MLKVNILRSSRMAHTTVPMIWLDQKKALSAIFVFRSSAGLSNLQLYLPLVSSSLHHLRPTSNLPVTFLTTQKSKELKRMTKINVMMLESIIVPITR